MRVQLLVSLQRMAWNLMHTHLGGEDFDDCLVNHFAQEFKWKNKKGSFLFFRLLSD